MAWKGEKGTFGFNIDSEHADKLYIVARKYCQIGDIAKEAREDGRIAYRITIKHKNINRLWRDIEVMKICGVDVKGGV